MRKLSPERATLLKPVTLISKDIVVVSPDMHRQAILQTRTLLQGLARALYHRERISVLKLALLATDHQITTVHDKLCQAGAVVVLMRCLQQTVTSNPIHWEEAHQICQWMEMSFRCSDIVAIGFIKANATELMILLFSILTHSDASRKCRNSVSLILRRMASLELSLPTIRDSNKLLSLLQQMLSIENSSDESVQRDAMHVLAGITGDPESQLYITIQNPSFFTNILSCSQASLGAELKLEVARVLQNLTVHSRHQPIMTQQTILEELMNLASPHQDYETQDQAIKALRNISVEAKGKMLVSTFRGGKLLKTLLKASENPLLRRIVVDTFLNVICQQTASLMCNQSGLVETIADFASGAMVDVAEKAAQILKRMATHISASHKAHPALFDAILTLSRAPKFYRVKFWVANAFLEQAKLSGGSFVLVRSPEALQQLCELAKDTNIGIRGRGAAVEALLVLTATHSSMKRIATNSLLLETFVEVIERNLDGDEVAQTACRNAILAILHLTENRNAMKRAAKHKGVVASLTRYGLSNDTDEELKQAALHGVILLAPEKYSSLYLEL